MQTDVLKTDLTSIKDRLSFLENTLISQVNELQSKEAKWKKMDDKVNKLVLCQDQIVKMNVGGTPFATKLGNLLKIKDTIFYKLIISEKFDFANKVLFFDRFDTYFGDILDFFRYNKINYSKYSKKQLEELLIEVEYYEISEILQDITIILKDISFVNFEVNSSYTIIGGKEAGTQNIKHINDYNDKSLINGIVANTPGVITFEINNECEIDKIEIGGWNGNPSKFSASNGANAIISTSSDKKKWTQVGNIPPIYGAFISNVSLTRSTGKYIQFKSTGYLGIGYLRVHKAY